MLSKKRGKNPVMIFTAYSFIWCTWLFFLLLFTFRLMDEQCSSGSESFGFCSHLLLFISYIDPSIPFSLSLFFLQFCLVSHTCRYMCVCQLAESSYFMMTMFFFFFYNKTLTDRHKIIHIITKKKYGINRSI
jgi:hypothetical protein